MNLTEIRTATRFLTKTDTTTFSDTDLDREANTVYNGLVLEMVQASGQLNEQGEQTYTDFLATDSLSAGDNGYNGEYSLPSDCLVLKRVEVRYTDDLIPVKLYDVSENSSSEFVNYSDGFSEANPKFRLFRNSIFIRPVPETTVTNGIYLEYIKRNAVLTASDSPVFETNLHDLIPLGTALRYFMRNPENYNQLIKSEYDSKLEDFRVWYRDKFQKVMKINTYKENF
jgi:hypothetical protein